MAIPHRRRILNMLRSIHYSWDRLLGACPYSFLDEEMYVWEALWATRPAARARPFCPASSEGPGGVAGAGGMSA